MPNRPLRITTDTLSVLSLENKLEIIVGLCKGVASIHSYSPPLYHRSICPDSFYLFEVKGRYKALLSKFDSAKDTSPTATFTVFKNLGEKLKSTNARDYRAPEIPDILVDDNIDWEKADIYSLAKTCLFILTSQNTDASNLMLSLENTPVSDEIKLVMMEMLDDKPNKRPNINVLLSLLS